MARLNDPPQPAGESLDTRKFYHLEETVQY